MKLSELKEMFTTKDIEQFKKSISQEISNYKNSLAKKGATIPITVIEDSILNIGNDDAIFLLETYISKKFSKYEIAYITDALLLSEMIKFDNEDLIDYFEMLTDVSNESALSFQKARQMILMFKTIK